MNEIVKASIPAALPTIMVLIGILLNKTDITAMRTEMATLRADMNSGFREMRAEFKDQRAEMLAMRKQQHDDFVNLMKSDHDQDSRIARLEDKS